MKRLAAAALAILCALQLLAVLRTPAAYLPATIELALAPSQFLDLGRHELAAPQAEARQLRIGRDARGHWWIAGLGAAHTLTLADASGERRLGSTLLAPGAQLRVGSAQFTVAQLGNGTLTLSGNGSRWDYDGVSVRRNGQPQPPCAATRMMPAWLSAPRPLSFGGNLHCGTRIGIAFSQPGAATITRSGAAMRLTPAPRTPVLVDGVDIASASLPLDGVGAIGLGRTRYGVHIDGNRLSLTPQRHVALYAEAQAGLPPGVSWQWAERSLWTLDAGPAALLLTSACAALLCARRYRLALPVLVAAAGVAALLLQRAGHPPAIGLSMLLGWSALWCFLLLPGRLALASAAGVLLLALGLLSQLELGLGAMASSWPRHFQKSCALLAIGLGAAAIARLWQPRPVVSPRRIEWLFAACALGALAALLLQVLFGDETGVFDVQPVEFAKLALTVLTAHCLAVGLGWDQSMPALRWFRLAAPALLFIALLGVALIEVDDYSPLILLLVWSMAMALAWSLATGRRVLAGLLLGCCALTACAIGLLRSAGVAEVAQWGFYAERFLVWLDPASHPHTGQQLLMAARAIGQGQWWGSDSLLGLSTLGQGAGGALAIPAVQDDFAPSFFLNRHGLAGALVLWMLQAAFLAGVLHAALLALAGGAHARDFRLAWLARFRCFALCGGAAFVLGHLLLSWGTNLAIFPIMGQPMSFLSAGGSHLLFFICPLLGFSALSAPVEESTPPRRADHAGLRPT